MMNARAWLVSGMVRRLVPCSLLLLAFAAGADPAADGELWVRLDAQSQASGHFQQALYGDDGELLERSSGRYAVLRPGYFRWHIEAPDRQQIVVAEGVLWHYDVGLATASQRRLDPGGQFSALDLLASDSDELAGRFRVDPVTDNRYRLTPLFPQAGFSVVELVWDDRHLVGMDVVDRSGQELRLVLTPDEAPTPLAPEDFHFEPPAGVDVQRLADS